MPRERVKLTDKEERILVQAQLMGLSTASMVKIGNRLRALEKEREEIAQIEETVQGFVWDENVSIEKLKVTTPEGYVVEATRKAKGKSHWNQFSWNYDIVLTKPGTRFKARRFKDKSLSCSYDWKKKLMPAKSKELYSLIRWVRNAMPYEIQE